MISTCNFKRILLLAMCFFIETAVALNLNPKHKVTQIQRPANSRDRDTSALEGLLRSVQDSELQNYRVSEAIEYPGIVDTVKEAMQEGLKDTVQPLVRHMVDGIKKEIETATQITHKGTRIMPVLTKDGQKYVKSKYFPSTQDDMPVDAQGNPLDVEENYNLRDRSLGVPFFVNSGSGQAHYGRLQINSITEPKYVFTEADGTTVLAPTGGILTKIRAAVFNKYTAMALATPPLIILGGSAALFGPFYLFKTIFNMAIEKYKQNLENPGFVDETDWAPIHKRIFRRKPKVGTMNDFVGPEDFKNRLFNLIDMLKASKESKSPSGIMSLFYGSYGTGKTFVSKIIAREAGMTYAVINCSAIRSNKDFSKMLAKIFADARNRGTVLIFDEAEALFGDQSNDPDFKSGSTTLHKNQEDELIIKQIIADTGTPEKRPHIVLMSNHPGRLNQAFIGKGGRINVMLKFPAPDIDSVCSLLDKKLDEHAAALKVHVDTTMATLDVANQIGIRPGREIHDIVAKACLNAKILKQDVNQALIVDAANAIDADRAECESFRLPARGNCAPAEAKAMAQSESDAKEVVAATA